MAVNHHQQFLIPEKSFASMAKRDINRLAVSYGFTPADVGKVNIVVSEMISNLLKFAPEGGELLVRKIDEDGIEIICLDKGPGISDLTRMLEDGVSTSGTAGEGLGAITRQSDFFDIFSQQDEGTVILSHIYRQGKAPKMNLPSAFSTGAVLVPKPSEVNCGDAYALEMRGKDLFILAVDGLGHGTHAAEAAEQAVATFQENLLPDQAAVLRQIHASIRRTRGAVGFTAQIRPASALLTYCGIGNIAGKVFSLDHSASAVPYKNIISYNGILGHNIPNTLNNQQLEWNRNKLLVLHSDGIKSRWDLAKHPGIQRHHPTIIAAVIYKMYSRRTDDTLVLVCK